MLGSSAEPMAAPEAPESTVLGSGEEEAQAMPVQDYTMLDQGAEDEALVEDVAVPDSPATQALTNVLDELTESEPIDVANTVDLDDKGEENDTLQYLEEPTNGVITYSDDYLIEPPAIELIVSDGPNRYDDAEDHEHEEGEHNEAEHVEGSHDNCCCG